MGKKYIQTSLREALITESTDADQIRTGRVCPYCGGEPEFVDSKEVYSRSYGMIYLCRPCSAWVGVHKGSRRALGRLANQELRTAKKRAHHYFDQLWQRAIQQRGLSKSKARNTAYAWLSREMDLPIEHTHIGMFTIEQCEEVVRLCMPYIR
jgi:ribosomal protein L32